MYEDTIALKAKKKKSGLLSRQIPKLAQRLGFRMQGKKEPMKSSRVQELSKSLEIARESINLIKRLGVGQFGEVQRIDAVLL